MTEQRAKYVAGAPTDINKLPPRDKFMIILAQQLRAYGRTDFTIKELDQMVRTTEAKSGLVTIDADELIKLLRLAELQE